MIRRALLVGVLALCLAPAIAMFALSFSSPGAYSSVLAEERQWGLFWRSTWVCALATGLALVWGTITATAAVRLGGWRGALLETLCLIPLLVPSVVIAMGWIFAMGESGYVTKPLRSLFGFEQAPWSIFSEWGAAFVLSLCYFPCATVLAGQGLRQLNPMWMAAAEMQASRTRALWKVWRPLMMPYLGFAAVLVFLLCWSDFGVPSALRVNVYPVEIFTQLTAYYDVNKAIAFCLPPLILAVVLIVGYRLIARSVPMVGARSKSIPAKVPWVLLVGSGFVLLLSTGLPVYTLVRTSESIATFREALRAAGTQVGSSFELSALATPVLVVAAGIIAVGYRTLGPKSRFAVESALLVLLVLPGAAIGLGIVLMYTSGVIPTMIYQTPFPLVLAMLARLIPFPALLLSASLAAIHPRMQDAGRLSATNVKTFVKIDAPLALPGIIAAATVAFVFCMGELSASVLVNPPGFMTLPVRIAALLHFGEDRIVAALCLTVSAAVLGVAMLGTLLLNRKLELRFRAD